jgi:glycosyltransferase involved in cell wall biosynthesis
MQIVCHSSTQRNSYIERGAADEQCRVIRPAIDFSRIRPPNNTRLRTELGFRPDDFVIIAPGESTRATAHRDAVWAVGLLNALDERHRLLIWGRGSEADSVSRFAAKLEAPNLLVRAEPTLSRRVSFEELTSAADAALIAARGSVPALPIAICLAAGLPIVAPSTDELREFLEDHRTALMPPRATPRHFAQSIYELRKDPSLMKHMAIAARTQASEVFSLAKFLQDWQYLYQEVATARTSPGLSMSGHPA